MPTTQKTQETAQNAPETKRQPTNLEVIYGRLKNSMSDHAAAIPQELNTERFQQNCMAVLQGNKDLANCEPGSVVRTLMRGAYLGLDFFNGECYAIPYGGKCTFQTDYKGEIKVCKKYSRNPIKDIYAKLVREGDDFEEVIENGAQSVNFRPKPFNNGEIIGAFAVVLYADGSMIYDAMSKDEIELTRKNFSKAQNSKAWTATPGEMYKKTVLRRVCKLVDLDFDSNQKDAFEAGGDAQFDGQREAYEAKDVYAEEDVIDVEASDVE